MTIEIESLLKSIEYLMYGYNYEVCLGIDFFQGNSQAEFEKQLKAKYPETKPEVSPLIQIYKTEFWSELKSNHDYRGDDIAGLKISLERELKLKSKLQEYYNFIERLIDEKTKYFLYSDPDGIPGYPVYWDYRFVIMNDKNQIILIYGSSSD